MSRMTTEARNPASEKIDTLSPLQIVWLMADDDLTEALVLWWPSGTAWVVHGASTTSGDNHLDAA